MGPSCNSGQQKPSSASGTTEVVPLQQLVVKEQEEAKLSLDLTLSFAYM
jgi:hypothetical protein